MDIKHVLSCNPLQPAYATVTVSPPTPQTPVRWIGHEGGLVEIGHSGPGFEMCIRDSIEGLERAAVLPDVNVLHAGTGSDDQGRLVTAGGRVLGVTATGPSAGDARKKAYAAVDVINWDGMQYRRDIAAGIGTGERS